MSHQRKPLALALALNSIVIVIEVIGSFKSNSMSLALDAVHNISDETALVLLYLANARRSGLSGQMVRAANVFNSIGILVICGLALFQVVRRLIDPTPVLGVIPIVAGLLGAALNWGVARALKKPAQEDASIRLAYAHNLGDTLVSLGPVLAGILIMATGQTIFDPLVALIIAITVIIATVKTIWGSSQEILWPKKLSCGSDGEHAKEGLAQ